MNILLFFCMLTNTDMCIKFGGKSFDMKDLCISAGGSTATLSPQFLNLNFVF